MAEDPEHRSILVLDIEGYGRVDRTDLVRLQLHRRLDRLCRRLLRRAGARADQYGRQDTGDGFLISIQAQVAKTRLLAAISWLAAELARDNHQRPDEEQLRLRASLHAGEVFRDPDPLYGDAIVFACRLLDADVLRACLRETSQPLALIVSQAIHDEIIRHHFPHLDPAGYHPVIVRTKEARRRAWIHVPGDPQAPVRAGVVASTTMLVHGEGPIPRTLPPDIPVLTGRDDQLRRLHALLGRAGHPPARTVTVVLHGPPGVGKSALAIRAAHQLAEQFHDGQLYVDLRGPTPGLAQLQPVDVQRQFLQDLETTSTAMPADPHQIGIAYRSMLAGRRLLIVLDNAQDAAQVRPLLPGHATCAVLITSRATLGELEGAIWLALDVLDPEAAVELLGLHAGPERIAEEPIAAAELARRCGYLPLALRIIGARAGLYPIWTLHGLAERLADEHRRLDELRLGSLEIRASFQLSYRTLVAGPAPLAEAARLFRLLGLLPTSSFSVAVAAALLNKPQATGDAVLERLVDEHLVTPLPNGRYSLHDLIRLFSQEQAADEPARRRHAAYLRVLGLYLNTVRRAARFLRPDQPARPFTDQSAPVVLSFESYADALSWLDDERDNLVAIVRQAATASGRAAWLAAALALELVDYLDLRSAWGDWEQFNRLLLRVAEERGDPYLAGQAWNATGRLALRRFASRAAADAFHRSLELRRAAGDRWGEANTRSNLGVAYRQEGRLEEAQRCYEDSLAIYGELDSRLQVGQTLGNLGNVYQERGQLDEALRCYEQSLMICRAYQEWRGAANALHGLGLVRHARQEHSLAIEYYEQELRISQDLRDRRDQADAWVAIGEAHHAQGALEAATRAYQNALSLQREIQDAYATATTLWRLGLTLRAQGDLSSAMRQWGEAAAIFEELERPEAATLRSLLERPDEPA